MTMILINNKNNEDNINRPVYGGRRQQGRDGWPSETPPAVACLSIVGVLGRLWYEGWVCMGWVVMWLGESSGLDVGVGCVGYVIGGEM